MDVETGAWLALVGLAAGLSGGLLGIGGSIVMIPAMTELMGSHPHKFQAAALIANFFVAGPALVQHIRARATIAPVLRTLIPATAVAALVGVACSEAPLFRGDGAVYLTGLFGVFLLYVAISDVARGQRGRPKDHSAPRGGWITARRIVLGIAIPTGLVSGLLGVGGGVLSVPLQQRILRIPLRSAIANSAATIVALSLVSATAKMTALALRHPDCTWDAPVRLAAFLIPSAIVGASIGGRLTHVLPLGIVRAAFIVLLIVAGIRMIGRLGVGA